MRVLPLLVCLAATTFGAVVVGSAGAQEISAAQKKEFAEAQTLFDGKQFDQALPKFRDLFAQTQSPNARLYVARCLRELGDLPAAYEEMSATVKEARLRAEKEDKYVSTRDAAAAELALLEPRVGHVVIALTDAPGNAVVTLDGAAVAADAVGKQITVLPGAHEIHVDVPDAPRVSRTVEVAGGETETVAISLGKATPDPIAPPKAPTPATATSSGGEVRIVGIVAAVLGAGGLAAFGATFALAEDRFATLETECGDTRCTDARYEDIIDEGKTFETVSWVTLGVGAAFVLAAIPMIILGGPTEETTVAVAPTAGGGVLRVRHAF